LQSRWTKITLSAGAAVRLLLFTGCRLREILNLKWDYVDLERGVLFLPDSKSGRKTVILNAPAMTVLNGLERIGPFVVPGDAPENPRSDLKRPWQAITTRAGLAGRRLHDLRDTYVCKLWSRWWLGASYHWTAARPLSGIDHCSLCPSGQRSASESF
jgi:integrase